MSPVASNRLSVGQRHSFAGGELTGSRVLRLGCLLEYRGGFGLVEASLGH